MTFQAKNLSFSIDSCGSRNFSTKLFYLETKKHFVVVIVAVEVVAVVVVVIVVVVVVEI